MAIKGRYKDYKSKNLYNREEANNDNSKSTIEERQAPREETREQATEETKQERPTTPSKPKEYKDKAKPKKQNAMKIERPVRDIQVNTRITKEQYTKLYNDASNKGYKSVSDYIYYLITLNK